MSKRQSRRTRGEKPELVPPKSDEEPDLDDNYVDENGNNIAVGAIRGRRRGKRGRSKDLSSVTPKGSSSSLSQLGATTATAKKKPGPKKRGRPRGRPPRNKSPTPSQASSLSASASPSMDENEDDDETMETGSNNSGGDLEDSNHDDSNKGEDDAERDTEDDAPKEALTVKKKGPGRPRKKKPEQPASEEAPHPRYKNPVKVECRHCGKLCFSQGIKIHEKSCMPVYTPRDPDGKKTEAAAAAKTKAKKTQPQRKRYERRGSSSDSRRSSSSNGASDGGSSSSDISDDTSSPPSPVVIVRKKSAASTTTTPKKSTATGPLPKSTASDPPKPYICRNCGKFFTPRGINAHEKRCMPVYTERASSSPDIKPKKKPHEKEDAVSDHESEEDSKQAEDAETASSSSSVGAETSEMEEASDAEEAPKEDSPAAPPPKPKPLRECKHCGKLVDARGFKQHERSCAKKERVKTRTRNKKIAEAAKATKKRKRKSPANATTTDDESLMEDDGSSSAAKAKGKTAQGNDGKDPPPSELALPKKTRRKKKLDKQEEENADDSSSTSGGEKPPKKKKKAVKTKDDEAESFSEEDLLPISALASASKPVPKPPEKRRPGRPPKKKKAGAKNSKLSKAAAAAKGKITPITEFFSRKKAGGKKEDNLVAGTEEDKVSGKANAATGDDAVVKDEAASAAKKQSSADAVTETTGETIAGKEGSSNKIGKNEGQKSSTKSTLDSASKTKTKPAPTTKKDGVPAAVDGEKKAKASKTESSKVKPAAAMDTLANQEPNSIKLQGEGSTTEKALPTPIETEDTDPNDDSAASGNRKTVVEKEVKTPKAMPSTRPSRKRKLTPKAAQAAEIIATKNEEKKVGSEEIVESGPEKKAKTKHSDDDNNGESEPVSESSSEEENQPGSKDQKGKASIVEAAKSAAAATLAAFSLFAPKPKSVEGAETAESESQSAESPSPPADAATETPEDRIGDSEEAPKEGKDASPEDAKIAKPAEAVLVSTDTTSSKQNDDVATPSNDLPRKEPHDSNKTVEAGIDTPPGGSETEKPTEVAPTAADTTSPKENDAVDRAEEPAPKVVNDTLGETSTSPATSAEPPQSLPDSNSGESPAAVEKVLAKQTADTAEPTEPTEEESAEASHAELESNKNKSSTTKEKTIDVETKEDSISLAKDPEASQSENVTENVTTDPPESAESPSDAKNDANLLNKVNSIKDNSPVTSDETSEDLKTADPDNSGSSERDVSTCEENRAENTSATEELTTSTNDSPGGTTIDQGDEKSAKDSGMETVDVGGSNEQHEIQSSGTIAEAGKPLSSNVVHTEASVDQASPQSPIEANLDDDAEGNTEEVEKPTTLPTGDKDTIEGSEEASVAAEEKEAIVQADKEKDSSRAEGSDQQIVSKQESTGRLSSEDLGDNSRNVEDSSKKLEKSDAELPAQAGAEIPEEEPNVTDVSQNTNGENGEEVQDATKKAEDVIEANPAESNTEAPSSSDQNEPISDSLESEKTSKLETRSNETRLSEDVAPTNGSSADKPDAAAITATDTTVTKSLATISKETSKESENDASTETAQLPEVSKREILNDEVVTTNASHSENPSQADVKEKSDCSKSEKEAISQQLENTVHWNETVPIPTEAVIDSKDDPSKLSATTPKDNTKDSEHQDKISKEEEKGVQKDESNAAKDVLEQDVESIEKPTEEGKECEAGIDDVAIIENAAEEANGMETETVATGLNNKNSEGLSLSKAVEDKTQEDEGDVSGAISNEVENRGLSSVAATEGMDLKSTKDIPHDTNSQQPDTPLLSDSGGQETTSKEGDSTSQAKNLDGAPNALGQNLNDGSKEENFSSRTQLMDSNEPKCDKMEEPNPKERIEDLPAEPKSSLETSAIEEINTETQGDEDKDTRSKVPPSVTDTEELKSTIKLSQADEKDASAQINDAQIDVAAAAQNDVSAIVESLLDSVEERAKKSLVDVDLTSGDNTPMEVDDPVILGEKKEENNSNDREDTGTPLAVSASGVNEVSEESDSAMAEPEEEELKISWVSMSKAPRQSKPVKERSNFIGYDENKANRVKMLLYTAGSKIHRGRGFERIFGMYWDAICLRLSRPLNENASKRCDEAISAFLKSRKLRRIHNKFVMGIMRRALKDRVPYSEVSEHIPTKWQSRVKVPQVVTSRKVAKKKKNNSFRTELENDLLGLSSVPHVDNTTPYKERWEFPTDEDDEILHNPKEGPSVPIASSCIPGALVVDPMIRETVEASDMKVTDSAMWLLTVALKEHIKNILNDSIEYKKGLKKGEVFPQAIHYPNVLASNSNKNRKISKGRSSAASLENGRKKRINSIDLFAALNMLPSGQPSSIGGSVTRVSLEQTFLSGFNSIPSFDTGNTFKDVHSFVSNTLTEMAKNRKPEEKKGKAPHTKSTENLTSKNRNANSTPGQEDSAKTPSTVKTSKSIATPIASLESPPLVQNLSPAVVQTPVLDSSTPKIDASALASEKQNHAATSNAPATDGLQGVGSGASGAKETKATNVEKPVQKATAGGLPSQAGPQRSGAGRGAKNLAALMARAAESSSSLGEEKNNQTKSNSSSTQNEQWPSSTAAKSDQNNVNADKPSVIPTKQTAEPPNNGEAKQSSEGDAAGSKEQLTIPPRQPAVPVRRGKGKGFGSKDLAAMRARSMTTTTTTTQTGGTNDAKPADK